MERRRQEGAGEQLRALERGWFLGDEQFRRELLEQVSARPGPRHFGEAVQEASEAQAERLLVEGLKRLGWTEEVLRAKRKGDASKVALARELRSRTTMPLAWIAERLWMGRRGVPGLAVGPPGGGFGRQPGGAGGAAFMTISLTPLTPLMLEGIVVNEFNWDEQIRPTSTPYD